MIIFKIVSFFKSGFNRCRKENYVKNDIKTEVRVLNFLLGSFKDMNFDEI